MSDREERHGPGHATGRQPSQPNYGGSTPREEFETSPDTLGAIAKDIKAIRFAQQNEIDEIKAEVFRLGNVLGEPAKPANFPGDPKKPATGLCYTIDRIATEQARRTRLTVLSSTGVAAIITALAQFIATTRGPLPSPTPPREPAPMTFPGGPPPAAPVLRPGL